MPASPLEPRLADAADRAACRAAIRTGSKSFYASSMLLPHKVRAPAYGLYAFCRLSDDAVDEADDGRARLSAMERLSRRLERVYAGAPADHPADRAFAEVVATHAIPQALPLALLEGLAWDAHGRRYESLSDLSAYGARVAGAVGAMMTLIMGVRDPDVLARACDLGVAMQFTNIARDVGEDARAGRLYLPLDWMEEAGIDADAFLADPRATPAIRGLVARLLDAADALYLRAEPGIAGLPAGCRPAIRAARLIYAEIGRVIEANGLDSLSQRARVTGARKVALLAQTAVPPLFFTTPHDAPPLPEMAFLVEAITRHPVATARRLPHWWDVSGQIVHVLDLIEVLRERESLARTAAP